MVKPYSITVNLPNDDEITFYEGMHWDSAGSIEQDIAFFKRLYPRWTSLLITIVNKEAKHE